MDWPDTGRNSFGKIISSSPTPSTFHTLPTGFAFPQPQPDPPGFTPASRPGALGPGSLRLGVHRYFWRNRPRLTRYSQRPDQRQAQNSVAAPSLVLADATVQNPRVGHLLPHPQVRRRGSTLPRTSNNLLPSLRTPLWTPPGPGSELRLLDGAGHQSPAGADAWSGVLREGTGLQTEFMSHHASPMQPP